MAEHELMYQAGTRGLGPIGIPDRNPSDWFCKCGAWSHPRNPRTGAPHKETATKHWRKHVREAEAAGGE